MRRNSELGESRRKGKLEKNKSVCVSIVSSRKYSGAGKKPVMTKPRNKRVTYANAVRTCKQFYCMLYVICSQG